jgi:hypothetical protein
VRPVCSSATSRAPTAAGPGCGGGGPRVGIVLAGDLALFAAGGIGGVWLDIVVSTVFVVATAVIMLSSLNADPLTLVSSAKRAAQPTDWLRARAVVPLIVGALAAEVEQLSLFERQSLLQEICGPSVDPSYFEQVAQIIPLLLITLGIEFGFFHATPREPTQRAATATTVTLMSIGLVCALSTLPWVDAECGQILEARHEYLAFVVSLQAIFTGLASLVWLLVVNVPDEEGTKPKVRLAREVSSWTGLTHSQTCCRR